MINLPSHFKNFTSTVSENFCSLICSDLSYFSLIWNTYIHRIYSILKKFPGRSINKTIKAQFAHNINTTYAQEYISIILSQIWLSLWHVKIIYKNLQISVPRTCITTNYITTHVKIKSHNANTYWQLKTLLVRVLVRLSIPHYQILWQ